MFERRISHDGLRSFRIVRGSTEQELEAKVQVQYERWAARYHSMMISEITYRKRQSGSLSKEDGERSAFKLTAELEYSLALIQSLLKSVLEADSAVSLHEQILLWAGQADEHIHLKRVDELAPAIFDESEMEFEGSEDPMYQDAVRVVLEVGKASTSTLQRRLRLGYGRAARILDMMQSEGIIGAPDGSAPRAVLRRPDWLQR